MDQENIIFTNLQKEEVEISLRFFDSKEVNLSFEAEGWDINPSTIKLSGKKGESLKQTISINTTDTSYRNNLKIFIDGKPAQKLNEIDYLEYSNNAALHVENFSSFNYASKILRDLLQD